MKPVEEYIFKQPEFYRSILLHLIDVIENKVPLASLEFKYGIPYFYLKKQPFCYLTANHKNKFVDLGFAKGFQLNHNLEFLVYKGRNTVKSLRYYSLEEINSEVLVSVLQEASELYK